MSLSLRYFRVVVGCIVNFNNQYLTKNITKIKGKFRAWAIDGPQGEVREEELTNLREHVDLLLAAVLGDLDPLVDEPDPDVVSLDVCQVGPQVLPHLLVDGQR